ncbi:MAG TPA: DMT family transporter [Paracoccaceae bacterium]|nr:DMT family transporter [Paracoccaceae bacterium]
MRAGKGSLEAFAPLDWGLLAAVALMWGASFLLIDLGLDSLHPASVAWMRLAFGAATLACIPQARRPMARADWPLIALLGCVWMAVPFLLFAVAQQWIASSLAGMINGAAPLFTAAIAALWYGRAPRGWQLAGLVIGFAGVLAIYWPAIGGVRATALGAGLILLATFLYGIAFNLAEPLGNRNGALPVIWRAQLVALVVLSPVGLPGLAASPPALPGLLAMAALGCFSTGLALAAFTTLVGRVGAARGSVAVYFVPVVAIVLGVVFRGESVAPVAMLGTVLVLFGAWLTSRRQRGPGVV